MYSTLFIILTAGQNERRMIGKIVFLYILTTALGRKSLDRFHPTDRHAINAEAPKDVYEYLGSRPFLRNDFVKLPKELFEKWFAKTQDNNKVMNEDATEAPVENTTGDIFGVDTHNDANDKEKANETDAKNDFLHHISKTNTGTLSQYLNDNFDSNKNYNNAKGNEVAAKLKLFGLIKDTKASVDRKTAPIQGVHDVYKKNRLYKIGYLVSNINRTQDSLTDFYKYIERNIRNWDILKVLDAYDQVKSADDFLSKALYILNLVGGPTNARVDFGRPRKTASKYLTSENGSSELQGRLAWSYYDDSL